jgi:hypothetical protein
MLARIYIQLQAMLKSIKRRDPPFDTIDVNIIKAVDVGLEKFNEYYGLMKSNDIYFIATVLDPRIKTQWIRDHLPDEADEIIERIKKFLKEAYPFEPKLPSHEDPNAYKSLEYRFLLPYTTE